MILRKHECEEIIEANENYVADIFLAADGKWYFRIEDEEQDQEQEVIHCPYCGKLLLEEEY